MTSKIHRKLLKIHNLDIGSFYFYDNFVIGEIKEGLNINFKSGKELFELTELYYKSTIPYVYISNRVNSYSFKPTGHFKSAHLFPNLKGYAIVTYDSINYKIAKLEQLFMNRPFSIFNSTNEAIDWVDIIIPKD